MEIGALFSSSKSNLVGRSITPEYSFGHWLADAEKMLRVVEKAGFRYAAVTHTYENSWAHPIVLLSRLAGISGQLRLSTEILQLPLLNPMDAAYELSLLDNICGGRLDIGVGIGYHPKELQATGITRADRVARFEEGVQIMRQFWSGSAVHHQGKHFTVDGLQLAVPPVQKPSPPLLGSSHSDAAAKRAARMLDGILISPQVTFADLKSLVDVYREEWAKHHTGAPTCVGAWRPVIIGENPRDAAAQGVAGGEVTFKRYGEGGMQEKSMHKIRLELKEDDAADWAILGNYEDILEGLRRCRDDFGINRLTCNFYNLPKDPTARREWLQGFGEQVISRL